jgi:hypothetical protein
MQANKTEGSVPFFRMAATASALPGEKFILWRLFTKKCLSKKEGKKEIGTLFFQKFWPATGGQTAAPASR